MLRSNSQDVRPSLLDVGAGQLIYWEESGNASGVPVLHVHGGPGSGLGLGSYRELFDLGSTRLIGFEQRGCGRSVPHVSDPAVSLASNDTAHLIADMEALRQHIGVDAWVLNGVSWGTTLALAYAMTHPERVLGMVLFAVTTTGRDEVDWITEGVGRVFPEAWERLAAHAEKYDPSYIRGGGRLVESYARLMESPDPTVRDQASLEWTLWEDTHVSIGAGGFARDLRWNDVALRHGYVRLVTHYFSNEGFNTPPILDSIDRLADIPATLIHGRRDISSPMTTAWQLHRQWPGSQLVVVEGDGHGGTQMMDEWTAAIGEHIARYQA